MRNQPTKEIYGEGNVTDYRDIGVKWQYVYSKQIQETEELAKKIEYKDDVLEFMEEEGAYPLAGFDGIPEFAIADMESYDLSSGQLPYLRFHSHMTENEMMPLPE